MSNLPFHSFTFTLIEDRRPRVAFKLAAAQEEGDLYELEIQRGPASSPSVIVKRRVPIETAERVRDALQEAGAFGWEESYGDESAPGTRRWTLGIVFQEGVFSQASRGGSDVPEGFDRLLEELYRLDFPRPSASKGGAASSMRQSSSGFGGAFNALGLGKLGNVGGLSAGDLGAYAATGKTGFGDVDFARLSEMMSSFGGAGGDMARLMSDVQRDPQALQRRMRDEFRHMSASQQDALIDMLVQTGMGTREFWERFFRG